jgi:hypothetical protein
MGTKDPLNFIAGLLIGICAGLGFIIGLLVKILERI